MKQFSKAVKVWLVIGCVLVFFQIIIGGITRITGSGLSITKWEIVTGTFPPTSTAAWDEAFDLYKETPQYQKINAGMSMSEFKFIYFWEYFHRLWARMMGFIFLFPFIYFLLRKEFNSKLLRYLGLVIFFAVLAAAMGWIMVASGLLDRPWVNAYKLALHLSVALLCFSMLVWTTCYAFNPQGDPNGALYSKRKVLRWFLGLLALQLFVGGVMSGMKAGLLYPTWPDMNGEVVPAVLWKTEFWNVDSFNLYDKYPLLPSLVQTVHRFVAYALFIWGIRLFIQLRKIVDFNKLNFANYTFISLLITQVILGILTVINCKGNIPLFYGVMHQAVAILLLSTVIYLNYISSKAKIVSSPLQNE